MQKFIFLIFIIFLVPACASHPAIKKPPLYPSQTVLVVRTPEINPEIYEGMDAEDKKDFDDTTSTMIEAYFDSVQDNAKNELKFKEIQIAPKEIAKNTDTLILEATFTKIKSGNKYGRFTSTYLIGLPGFFKPVIEIECRLIDSYSGRKIDDKTEGRDSSWRIADFKDDISIMWTEELAKECVGLVESYMSTDLNESD